MDSNPTPSKRRRARKADGKYQGDNPATPHNEAYEALPIEDALSTNEVTYGVKQKVDGSSKPTAGKYAKKGKVRPTFGNVTSTTF